MANQDFSTGGRITLWAMTPLPAEGLDARGEVCRLNNLPHTDKEKSKLADPPIYILVAPSLNQKYDLCPQLIAIAILYQLSDLLNCRHVVGVRRRRTQ